MKQHSRLMELFLFFGRDSIAWSLRRLHCPVEPEDLVLEVGSGGNPYFRSNVLLDAYEETRERHWEPLVQDRPTVLGFVEKLPFKDKAFDFVVASHVLEHSTDPAQFLGELQRVAKAGYIEVPDAFMERVNPYRDHRLEITTRDGRLLIRKKKDWQVDPELVELYEAHVKPVMTGETMRRHPFRFHVRYYWNDRIDFEVLNPEVDACWTPPEGGTAREGALSLRRRFGRVVVKWVRTIFSQHRRNAGLALTDLLACPSCRAPLAEAPDSHLQCSACSRLYPVRNGVPVLYPADTDD